MNQLQEKDYYINNTPDINEKELISDIDNIKTIDIDRLLLKNLEEPIIEGEIVSTMYDSLMSNSMMIMEKKGKYNR